MLNTILLSFYVSCSIAPMVLVAFVVASLLRRGSLQVLLCMECEQCKGACPVYERQGSRFPGPKEIMAASKSNKAQWAVEQGALLCTGCRLCEKVCQRGLAPYKEVEKWRSDGPR